ncbi:histone-lysine N-methyltransferase SETMAR-like [Harpegnathos saltator]|uniref:histone-lysine N-methyltransferase SETMAR-like n=1 Tax=Harpegnathos saltator TaxID=610380 RepID=UPI000DBEE8F9|nr:histone-lysine N-methyltransferase SETMAR-like [Harpegnathos saltator]
MHAVDDRKRLTDENIKKVHKIILNDRRVKLIDIAETLKISKERVGHIVHEYLNMRKLCAKWVPRVLTIDPKQQRFDDSEQYLAIFNRNKDEFFRPYITMDETWLHHYTPESNRQSAEWTERDEPKPKRGKKQQSTGKVMASVFWDARGIIFIDYLEKGQTINSEYYITLLERYELLPHPPYSPDLAPSDFFLFADLKRMLAGKKFSTDEEVIAEAEAYFEAKEKSYYKNAYELFSQTVTRCHMQWSMRNPMRQISVSLVELGCR